MDFDQINLLLKDPHLKCHCGSQFHYLNRSLYHDQSNMKGDRCFVVNFFEHRTSLYLINWTINFHYLKIEAEYDASEPYFIQEIDWLEINSLEDIFKKIETLEFYL